MTKREYASIPLRPLLAAPPALVSGGRISFGTFDAPLRRVNPLDARRIYGVPLPRFLTALRLKEWQAFQLGNDECFMLAVIYNQKVGCLIQFIVHDRRENRTLKYERQVPSWRAAVPSSLYETDAHYRSRDFTVEFENHLERGIIGIAVSASLKGLPPLTGRFTAHHDAAAAAPMVVSLPLGPNRGMYSHKCLMPMTGEVAFGDRRIVFARESSFAIMDDHKGHYPYVLKYDWVTGAGFDGRGRRVGFNLTANQVLDPERYNENCLWIGNRLHLLPPVRFSRPEGPYGEWIIRDAHGLVDLRFRPVTRNELMVNYLAIRTVYYGPFGTFTGTVASVTGERVAADTLFGMGEQKYLRG